MVCFTDTIVERGFKGGDDGQTFGFEEGHLGVESRWGRRGGYGEGEEDVGFRVENEGQGVEERGEGCFARSGGHGYGTMQVLSAF